jgi:hypothetical protein
MSILSSHFSQNTKVRACRDPNVALFTSWRQRAYASRPLTIFLFGLLWFTRHDSLMRLPFEWRFDTKQKIRQSMEMCKGELIVGLSNVEMSNGIHPKNASASEFKSRYQTRASSMAERNISYLAESSKNRPVSWGLSASGNSYRRVVGHRHPLLPSNQSLPIILKPL